MPPEAVWRAQYEAGRGKFQIVYEVECETRECPVAAITPESRRVLREVFACTRVHRATGASRYGPDTSQWPARWFDAVELVQLQLDVEDAACKQAIARRQDADA